MRHEHIRFGTVGGSRLREPARRPPLQTPERRRALKTSEKQPKVSYESRRSGGSSSYTDFCAHLGLEFTRSLSSSSKSLGSQGLVGLSSGGAALAHSPVDCTEPLPEYAVFGLPQNHQRRETPHSGRALSCETCSPQHEILLMLVLCGCS